MTFAGRVASRIGVTVAVALAVFVGAAVITQAWWDRSVLPDLVKRYPHDVQLGLEGFTRAISTGIGCAVIVLLFGFVWTLNTSHKPDKSD